jgi:hypothetical protein
MWVQKSANCWLTGWIPMGIKYHFVSQCDVLLVTSTYAGPAYAGLSCLLHQSWSPMLVYPVYCTRAEALSWSFFPAARHQSVYLHHNGNHLSMYFHILECNYLWSPLFMTVKGCYQNYIYWSNWCQSYAPKKDYQYSCYKVTAQCFQISIKYDL